MVAKKRTWFLIGVIPVLGFIIYLSRSFVTLFLLAFFIAYAINPLVNFLEQKGASRSWAILTIYFVLGIITAMITMLLVPRLIGDLTRAIRKLPALIHQFQIIGDYLDQIFHKLRLPPGLRFVSMEFTRRTELILRRLMIDVTEGVISFFSQTIYLILVPLLSYYISRDYPRIKQETYQWLSKNLGYHWTRTFIEIDSVLRSYIRGQLLVTLCVGFLIGIGLALSGFETAFFLGLLAGIFNLIPYFGPVLGALPVMVFALLKSPWYVFYVIFLFTLINQLEVMFLTPKIIGGSLGVHPLFVIYLVLVGGKILGLWGMIFAVPLGTIVWILIKSVYEICFGLAKNEPIPERLEFKKLEPD